MARRRSMYGTWAGTSTRPGRGASSPRQGRLETSTRPTLCVYKWTRLTSYQPNHLHCRAAILGWTRYEYLTD